MAAGKPKRFDKATLEEAQRIHRNICELRTQGLAELDERIASILDAKYWPGLSMVIGDYCGRCLGEGLGWFALYGDIEKARAAFADAALALPYYRRMHALRLGAETNPDAPPEPVRRSVGAARQFEQPLLCLIFGDAREAAMEVSRIVADEEPFPGFDHFDVFTRHLAAVLRCERERVSWADYERMSGGAKWMINPYRRPLVDFAGGDAQAISAAVSEFEAGYATRGRMRDSTHLEYGASKLGQAMTFDVYGAALLKLASWFGVENTIDTRALPAAFCR